jgi:hypothetical protein
VIAPHAVIPEHSTLQFLADLQSMSRQALVLLHLIVQSKPAGHWTAPHGLFEVHSILQVLSPMSHAVHGLGQAACTQ